LQKTPLAKNPPLHKPPLSLSLGVFAIKKRKVF
jgi:hypothetical protein